MLAILLRQMGLDIPPDKLAQMFRDFELGMAHAPHIVQRILDADERLKRIETKLDRLLILQASSDAPIIAQSSEGADRAKRGN
jgi:hypothetical protein